MSTTSPDVEPRPLESGDAERLVPRTDADVEPRPLESGDAERLVPRTDADVEPRPLESGDAERLVPRTDADVEPRPLESGDAERLVRMFSRLSAQTVRRRFFTVVPRLDGALLDSLTAVDHDRHEALVVIVDDEVVGVASYHRDPDDPSAADVAVLVEDGWQQAGLGRRLVERLAGLARGRGIERFHADVLVDNRPAVGFIRRMNPTARGRYDGADGALSFDLPLVPAA